MTDTKTIRRKTEQAIKISASWTPNDLVALAIGEGVFSESSPLRVRGGRLTINAAIAIDMSDPTQAALVAARVQKLRLHLQDLGTVHTFTTQAGSVPVGEAEHLAAPEPEQIADAA